MWRTARDSVCLLTTLVESGRPWINQRTFGTRGRERERPSRMVLSDRVARGPRPEAPRRPRDKPDGPWAGTNRTVANVDRGRGRSADFRDRDSRDGRNNRSLRDDRGDREGRDSWDSRSGRNTRSFRDEREGGDSREFRDSRGSRSFRDDREGSGSRDFKADRESRDSADARDNKSFRDDRGGRDARDSRDSRDVAEGRDSRTSRDNRGDRSVEWEDTRKALKMQRALTSIPYRERLQVKARISDIETFGQFRLVPPVRDAIFDEVLKGMTDIKPTPVQKLAIPALLGRPIAERRSNPLLKKPEGRQEFLLAAETGSGKTLAYLAPIMHSLKVAEADDEAAKAYNERLAAEKEHRGGAPVSEWIDKFEPHPNTARPRAIVLVPTSELVDQVLAVAKHISHVAKLKVRPLSANYNAAKLQRNLYSHGGIDMVIATPHLLAAMAEKDPNILSRVHHLVVDEADSLFDRSFSPETSAIVDRAMPSIKQLILCSATIPRRLDNYLAAHFPHVHRIATPNLHAIPRRVQLGVIDVSRDPYRNNKLLACADAIWSIGKDAAQHEGPVREEVDVKRIMVFVNERETTQEVADYLISKGIDAVALHRDTPEHRQSEMLANFTSNEPMRISKAEVEANKQAILTKAGTLSGGSRRHLPNTKVIVATDLASRGIDTLAVRHVVLYDVPHTTIDFIHRLGRAGRMGRRGRGIVLVGKNDRRDVVAEVKESMYMGQALI
ncbi:RNA helicase [Collariella sp. IMI 366227]|nr:RNA helicase [Collariella sp. IMI 366227]